MIIGFESSPLIIESCAGEPREGIKKREGEKILEDKILGSMIFCLPYFGYQVVKCLIRGPNFLSGAF